jgi:kynurenine formamidase
MRIKTFVIGYALALGLLLFAQRRPDASPPPGFRGVIDLTHTVSGNIPTYEPGESAAYRVKTVATIEKDGYFAREISLGEHFGTHIDAPAHFARGSWTVDQIPEERLVAPLVVIDITKKVGNDSDYRLSVEDIAHWEETNGQIPQGSVVMASTGWDSRWKLSDRYRSADAKGVMHFPGYSLDAAKFLVEARGVLGLGIDTLSIDYGPSKSFEVHHYTLTHGIYHIENVANLERTPPGGAIAVVAPMKLKGGSGGPVRVMALLR